MRSRAFLADPVLTCMLEGHVAVSEEKDPGLKRQLIAVVEDALGRRVVSHCCAVDAEQGVAVQTFILERPNENLRAIRAQQDRLRRQLTRRGHR